ncbi:MAG: methyl-accepting chemotaxis protein [Lachnotalea sp.]
MRAKREGKRNRRKSSLLTKSIFINFIIVVTLITSIVTVLYRISAKEITSQIDLQMSLTLINAKNEIDSIRNGQEQQLTMLSKSSNVEDVLNGKITDGFEYQVDGLEETYSPYMESILLVNVAGKVLYDSSKDAVGAVDLSSREYFQESMNGNVAHSQMLVSKNTGNIIEVISVPIERDGRVIGVLATCMNIEYIKSILQEIKIGENGYVFLIDENGNFIYHPKAELINTNMVDLGIQELEGVWPDMQAGNVGEVHYTYNNVAKMVDYIPVGSWTLCVNAVKSEYLSSVTLMLKEAIGIGLIMLILASLATAFNMYLTVKRIKKVQNAMGVATRGDLSVVVEEPNLKKCWEIMKCEKPECPGYKNNNLKCWEISKTLCKGEVQEDAINKLVRCKECTVYRISEGDELGQMARSLSIMITTIRSLIYGIAEIAEQLSSSSQELSSASEETTTSAESISEKMDEMSSNSQNQTEYVEDINHMTRDMNAKLTDSVNKIDHMSEEAGVVNHKAKIGQEKIRYTITGMEQIKSQTEKIESVMNGLIKQSKEIGVITSMITSIAEETNLLSLNASIEAARAGENGKGFGVVADEIGKLAYQSQESAKGISALIERITESIESASNMMQTETEFVYNGIQSVQESKIAFEEIADTVDELVVGMKEVVSFVDNVKDSSVIVTNAVEKMASIIEESSGDMEEVTAATEEQTSVSEEISRSATELARMAEELLEAVSEFKV